LLDDTGEKYNIYFIACNSELNQAVRRDVYQLSTSEEMMGSLKEGSVFFKLDLYANSGFHQIVLLSYMYLPLLHPEAMMVTPFGRYVFERHPFSMP